MIFQVVKDQLIKLDIIQWSRSEKNPISCIIVRKI